MPKVFLSYRRSDTTDVAGRLYDSLAGSLGRENVFKDVDSIDGGARFIEEIEQSIGESDAFLLLIGTGWLEANDAKGRRRLDHELDYVRREILTAYRLGRRIIPVLVGDAEMPAADTLPEPLRILPEINALRLRPDPDFRRDYQRIASTIGIRNRRWIWTAAGVGALALLLTLGWSFDLGNRVGTDPNEILPAEPAMEEVGGQPIVPFDPAFLGDGHRVPLPKLGPGLAEDAYEDGRAFDYLHYSLVMHEQRSMAIYAAINVDRSRLKRVSRTGNEDWIVDDRLPRAMQRDISLYRNNDWDRGHLVSPRLITWEDPVVKDDSAYRRSASFYSATAPQHANFNRFPWNRLEQYLISDWQATAERLIVFVGPVFRGNDPIYRATRIPQSFWAVAVAVDPSNPNLLKVSAFLTNQLLTDAGGEPVIGEDDEPVALERDRSDPQDFALSLTALSDLVGLDFGYLEQYDSYVRQMAE